MSDRARLAVAAFAWAAYAASWFLPTLKFKTGGVFNDLDAGWKAFLIVLSVVIKPEAIDFVWGLSVASVLSNIAVLISPWMLRKAVPARFVAILAIAFMVNLVWFILLTDSTLLAGYWLWVGSMGVLAAVGIANLRRSARIRTTLPPFTSD